MADIRKRVLGAFFIILAMTLCFSVAASADTQQQLDETGNLLNQLRNEQEQNSSELSGMNRQMDSINSDLYSIQTQIADKQSEIDALTAESEALSEDIDAQYESMKLRIRYMYENGTDSLLSTLLSAADFGEFLSRSEYIFQITKYDNTMMASLNDDMTRLTADREKLNSDMEELNSLKNSATTQSNNLKSLILDMKNKIDLNSINIEETEAKYKQLEEQLEAERIAALEKAGTGKNSSYVNGGTPIAYTEDDLAMLAAIVECEAANQPYAGKLAVASVVCNRVNSSKFDNTVSAVILSPKQFSPVTSGRFALVLARGANAECTKAAKAALEGGINVDAVYFIRYRGSQDDDKLKIGDHVFFCDWSLY
jgi:peptidoglycan hydrolase CwlO-like protein